MRCWRFIAAMYAQKCKRVEPAFESSYLGPTDSNFIDGVGLACADIVRERSLPTESWIWGGERHVPARSTPRLVTVDGQEGIWSKIAQLRTGFFGPKGPLVDDIF